MALNFGVGDSDEAGRRAPPRKGRARWSVRREEGRFMAKDGEKVRKKARARA